MFSPYSDFFNGPNYFYNSNPWGGSGAEGPFGLGPKHWDNKGDKFVYFSVTQTFVTKNAFGDLNASILGQSDKP